MLELLLWVLGLVILGTVSVKIAVNVSGMVSASDNQNFSDNQGIQANPSVPAAQPGTLTTRTNNTSGTLTMTNSNHGIITGQRVDLYWTGGQCYGAVVGTVSGTSVPIASVSGGSVLPSTSTVINVGICTSAPFACTGNNVQAYVLTSPVLGYFVFNNGTTPSSDLVAALVAAGTVESWKNTEVRANPLAGVAPTVIWMSHNSTSGAVTNMLAAAVTH